MTRSPTRRRYLTASAAAGIAALAGCSDLIEDYEEAEDPDDEGEEAPVDDVDHENPGGELAFVTPADGDQVTSPVEIEMEVDGLELQPVADEQDAPENGDGNEQETDDPEEGAGHLHVIVDEECLEPEYPIPFEDGYHHLEDGGTEIELELEPGEYDLCAQASDDQHNAYDMTDEITIEVVEDDENGADEDEGESEENGAGGDENGDNGTGENGNENGEDGDGADD